MMSAATIRIKKAEPSDWPGIWEIFREVASHGDTYTFAPDISEKDARSYWMNPLHHCYVAVENGMVLGTYIMKDNHFALGAHVANASFMVHRDTRGKGVGRLMGEHAIQEGKRLGYKAMQFNIVISTNKGAIALWERLGFRIIGTIPEGFKHSQLGYVDACIMHRKL